MSLLLKKCLAKTKIDISDNSAALETLKTFDTFWDRGHFGWVQDILDFLDILDLSAIMDILGHFRDFWIFSAFQTFLLIRPKIYKGAAKILIDGFFLKRAQL